ncbi:cupin domain-containing protein [Sinorhizobium fredii]|uniref:cupin domain-containing protein n=1 Tax=Rhizobium fredii TaxID=380 RepID=UPI003516ABD9
MNARCIIGAACAALAIATAMPAAAHDPGDVVTTHFEQAIPNIPGKTLTAQIVDYPPGGASVPHRHADSSFIFAYVLSGEIESKVNDGQTQIFRAGDSWHEPPASNHVVSRNASKTKPARLLAIVVADSDEKALTTNIE